MVSRRLNRSARNPPTGLNRAYTHLNCPSIRPQFSWVATSGTSFITDAWTDETCEGGRTLRVGAPLDRVPVFLRDGAELPVRA